MSLPAALNGIFKNRQRTYKMVLIQSILQTMDNETGMADFQRVKHTFLDFYKSREEQGLVVDEPPGNIRSWRYCTNGQLNDVLETPIRALGTVLRGGQRGDRLLGFRPHVWELMSEEVIAELSNDAQFELNIEMDKLWHRHLFSFGNDLQKFAANYQQAKTEPRGQHPIANLLEKEIPDKLRGLPFVTDRHLIQGSVGRPAWARMPWIAIMDKRVTTKTPRGYYVCYVFSEDMRYMYLTFKHSDEPIQIHGRNSIGADALNEKLLDMRSTFMSERFIKDDLVDLDDGYKDWNYLIGVAAYKRYDCSQFPSDEELFTDLQDLLHEYQEYVELQGDELDSSEVEEVDDVGGEQLSIIMNLEVSATLTKIKNFIRNSGFTYPKHLIENFYLSLKSKPFTILAGISGTGKTKLVKLFAEALGATKDNGQFVLIPVRPDWNDPADLIGYTDLSGKFRPGELTKVLHAASLNKNKPYFICLDEMNLARVEHYFSDLLSIMETQDWELDEQQARTGRIVTHDIVTYTEPDENGDPCEVRLDLPENVFLIGTVNMDETTHPFSKKVLDRANTIEFQHIDLTNFAGLDTPDGSRPEAVRVHQSFLRGEYLCLQDAWAEHKGLIDQTSKQMAEINEILQSIQAHVGYRVRDAVCFYLIYNQRFDLLPADVAFDLQVTQKILPRIQGSSRSVRGVLVDLMKFAAKDGNKSKMKAEELDDETSLLYSLVHKSKDDAYFQQHMRYPISARKIAFMLRRFDEDGFTSYWLS